MRLSGPGVFCWMFGTTDAIRGQREPGGIGHRCTVFFPRNTRQVCRRTDRREFPPSTSLESSLADSARLPRQGRDSVPFPIIISLLLWSAVQCSAVQCSAAQSKHCVVGTCMARCQFRDLQSRTCTTQGEALPRAKGIIKPDEAKRLPEPWD